MSDEDDPVSDADSGTADELEQKRREVKQRERGLEDFADELDQREAELDERERDIRKRKNRLDEREASLDERETHIEEREAELDDRETAIEERERELKERAAELEEKERTLQQYVDDTIREPIEESISETLKGYDRSRRLGTIGSLILGLVGVTLIVGGVLNGFADQIDLIPPIFASDTANLAATVLLVFSGLAANLAAVAD